MIVHVNQLRDALREREIHAMAELADPPDFVADLVNIWPTKEPFARYPADTVYAPTPGAPMGSQDSEWVWGPNFEHRAPGDIDLDTLTRAVIATLPETSS